MVSATVGAWLGGGGQPGAEALVPTSIGWLVTSTRLAVDGLAAASIGLALVPPLLFSDRMRPPRAADRARTRDVVRRVARLGLLVAAGWAVAALLALWLRAADASAVPPLALSPGQLGGYAEEVAAGRGLLLTLACALTVLVLWLTVARRASGRHGSREAAPRLTAVELALGIGLLGLLPGPVTGHAARHAWHDPAVLAIALHVVAASLWGGGLLAVVVVLIGQRRLLAEVLPRFSTLAGYCAGTVAGTGVLSAALRLPAPDALIDSGYGLLLLAKASCLLGLLGLGWRIRHRLVPRLAAPARAAGHVGTHVLAGWLGLELTGMAVVFGLAAALAESAPG